MIGGLGAPRIMTGNSAMMRSLRPALGAYFLNTDTRHVHQWNGVEWESIGGTGVPEVDDLLKVQERVAAARSANLSPGFGSAPGIRDSSVGDPSVNDPVLFIGPFPDPGGQINPAPGPMDPPFGTGDLVSKVYGGQTCILDRFQRIVGAAAAPPTTPPGVWGTSLAGDPWVPFNNPAVKFHCWVDDAAGGGIIVFDENGSAQIDLFTAPTIPLDFTVVLKASSTLAPMPPNRFDIALTGFAAGLQMQVFTDGTCTLSLGASSQTQVLAFDFSVPTVVRITSTDGLTNAKAYIGGAVAPQLVIAGAIGGVAPSMVRLQAFPGGFNPQVGRWEVRRITGLCLS